VDEEPLAGLSELLVPDPPESDLVVAASELFVSVLSLEELDEVEELVFDVVRLSVL